VVEGVNTPQFAIGDVVQTNTGDIVTISQIWLGAWSKDDDDDYWNETSYSFTGGRYGGGNIGESGLELVVSQLMIQPADRVYQPIVASPTILPISIAGPTGPLLNLPDLGGGNVADVPINLSAFPSTYEDGFDIRDGAGGDPGGDGLEPQVVGGAMALTALIVKLGPLSNILRATVINFFGRFAVGARVAWTSMPGWLRAALVGIGIPVGTMVTIDQAMGFGDGGGGSEIVPFDGVGGPLAHQTPHMVDGHLGGHVVGSWIANGVTFYRLSDGKLAVQNKRGRWKTWKPKKPIVLFADGAGDLRTLLRADAAVTRQTKKLAAMINRRAPRPRRKQASPVIIDHSGHQVS